MNSHTDNRRTLTEFGNGNNWKLCKVVKTKQDCILGRHYHKLKDESFMLVFGEGRIKLNEEQFTNMILFDEYFVPANVQHEFILKKNSILIGLSSKEFDPDDDYRL